MRPALLSIYLAAAAICTVPVHAKPAPQPPAPDIQPDWANASREAVAILKRSLFDPESAQITWISGYQWGYWKPLIGKRSFAWIACGNLNAKNRMGGYVGATGFIVVVEPNSAVSVLMYGDTVSTCDGPQRAPVNPELIAASAKPGETTGPSLADELRKLGQLRDDGILTQAEFDAQKAKLLGQ